VAADGEIRITLYPADGIKVRGVTARVLLLLVLAEPRFFEPDTNEIEYMGIHREQK
jgi:hypothetical protein